MQFQRQNNTYIIRLKKGEELIRSLEITLHKFEKLNRKMDQERGLTLLKLPNEL